jgi:hypothetical protein
MDPELEAAGERAYSAFVASAKEFLPDQVPTWDSLAKPIRKAWIAAAIAARGEASATQP